LYKRFGRKYIYGKTGEKMNNIFMDRTTGKFSAINFIVAITIAVHAIVLLIPEIGNYLIDYCGLSPKMVIFHGQIWRLISYALLHDTQAYFHIAFNMLMLWMFGKEIEYFWGSRKFFEFYIFSALFSGVFSLFAIFLSSYVNIIGASGALMALLVIYAHYFPERQLLFLFVIPMKVKTVVIVYAIISILGTAGNYGSISHITHLGGIVAGFIWIKIGDKFDLIIRNISAFFHNCSNQKNEYVFEKQERQKNNRAEEVDKILDKINLYGIQSLTQHERKILQDASADCHKSR
jgi:membrane associated rhomboid family serine protease